MLLNVWCWRRLLRVPWTSRRPSQHWIFIEKTDAEAPVLWPPDVKSWLFGKDSDTGKDWKQEKKQATEDEMVGWCHRVNGHVWANFRRWWRTGKTDVLQSMGSQRVTKGHTWLSDWTITKTLKIKTTQQRDHLSFLFRHCRFWQLLSLITSWKEWEIDGKQWGVIRGQLNF